MPSSQTPSTPDSITFNFIGRVRSNYQQKFGTPRQPGLVEGSRAFLEILPKYQPELSLDGLAGYSHLWVLFYFHRNDNARFHAKVHPPRLRGETVGLFASRTPHRPNPIGLSLLEIDRVEANGVWVRGTDILDATPILDIKPYLPSVESVSTALEGWSSKLDARTVTVDWSDEASAMAAARAPEFRAMVEQTIRLDPRPLVYQADGGGESHYRDSHVVMIGDLDVHFAFSDHSRARVLRVGPAFKQKELDSGASPKDD